MKRSQDIKQCINNHIGNTISITPFLQKFQNVLTGESMVCKISSRYLMVNTAPIHCYCYCYHKFQNKIVNSF
ncbi:hypothetical protein PUN28_008247 [Cardiocondyla obscurior]|uniref:Uncharacterized protein n=1 Tax=Cardiocondyla obscurior TaxID=286306 RepID=A0AAW2G200_9HYME